MCMHAIIGGDIPAQKLMALQKILQSDFFNTVRDVYEHIYETVDIDEGPEVRASAAAKVSIVSIPYEVIRVSNVDFI
jgi:hypothetical protein